MFFTTIEPKNLKFSLIAFIGLMLVAASVSFAAFGSAANAANTEKSNEEKLSSIAVKLKSVINGAYFSPVATFVVNNTGDSFDAAPGDGICGDSAGNCTLRAAIQESNASAGTDSITFALTNTPAIIQLNSALSPAELTITDPVTINGSGARLLTVAGNARTTNGVFNVTSAVSTQTSINRLKISNSGGYGINNDGRLALTDVSITTNRVGINNWGRLNINRAAISGNTSGGVFLGTNSVTNISNAIITSNNSSANGAGIYSLSADVTLNNVTVSHNTAATSGGGIYYNNAASGFYLRNTIIAKNTASNGPDIFSVNSATNVNFTSRGNNLIGKSASAAGFIASDKVGTLSVEIDPLLGPLQNNGGTTDTRALLPGSPAIDAGNICVISSGCGTNNPASPLNADQRGTDFPRMFDGNNDNAAAVDIGAFEAFYPVAAITSFVPNNWGTGKGAFELIINGTNFVADSKVKWNGQDRATTFISNNQIKAQILAADTATAGQYPVTVVNPTPGGGNSEIVNFPVTNCSYSINPTNNTFNASGGTGSVNVTAVNGCEWTAVTDGATWITLTGGGTGNGNGTLAYTVAANTGPARSATITVNGQVFTVNQNSGCTFAFSPANANSIPAAGGAHSFNLTTSSSGCAWTATSTSPWITVNTQSGAGAGTINYTVAANNGPNRNGAITVNGEVFNITQLNGCSFTLSAPTSPLIPAAGGNGNFTVNTVAGCSWTATSSQPWAKINSGASGSGNGTVGFTVDPNNGPARSATITVNGQTFIINQAEGCVYTLSAPTISVLPAGETKSVTVTASNPGCSWTSTVTPANASWITINSGASGTGNGTVSFTVAANTGAPRSGTIIIGGVTLTISQGNGCTYTLSSPSAEFGSVGGTGSFNVSTSGTGCTWTATTPESWITINSGSTGTGSGTVSFTVQPNVTPRRTGTITVNGVAFTITQENGCSFTLSSSTSPLIPAGGGTGSFTVNTGAGCTWTATSNHPWITVSSGASGTSSGAVNFTVAANNGPTRTGTITAGGRTYTINQDNGCTFTLLTANTNDVVAAGGTVTVTVTASNNGCTWTSSTNSNTPWITILSGGTGTGNGSVQLTIAANTGPRRSGTITIANQTFTVNQANGCVYTLSPTSLSVLEVGGNRSFNVITGAGCIWTAASNDSWITIISGASGSGNGTVNFSVAATAGSERRGTITVEGQTFTVHQVNLVVTNLNDNGLGSLRRAVENANASAGDDQITFHPSLTGTINLTGGEIIVTNNGALEIKGPGADVLKISGNNLSRIFYVNDSKFTLRDLTLTDGNGIGTGNTETTRLGGAIFVHIGSVSLIGVNVSRNTITPPNTLGSKANGGGVYIQGGINHLIQNSTISHNNCLVGGGLYNEGELTIINSTIAANTASKEGGGIYTVRNTKLRNSTITDNTSIGDHTGAGITMWGDELIIGNTIVAGNKGPEITFNRGVLRSSGYNLIGDTPGDSANTFNPLFYQSTDIRDKDPKLATLSTYGGKTSTAALMTGSPAIDTGDSTGALPTDQRGAARIIGAGIDIGAFEHNISVLPSATSLPDGAVNSSYSQELRAVRINGGANSAEQFNFTMTDGNLPSGVEMFPHNGLVQGTPTSGGSYTFTIKATAADGMAGANKYTMSIGCSYAIDPAVFPIGTGGGSGIVNVTTSLGCPWTAVNNVPWITIGNNTSQGTGNGDVFFTVAANSGAARSGTLTIAGKTFTVNQSENCTYNLSAASANIQHNGGTGTFNINTGASCLWTTVSNTPWITISGTSFGIGGATITISIAPNSTGRSRSGTVLAGGQTFTVNQEPNRPPPTGPALFDYDGDRRSDPSVYRSSTGVWHLLRSQDGYTGIQFGSSNDQLVPADYDGDQRTDLAVFREDPANPSFAHFFIMNSSDNTMRSVQFGSSGDSPFAVGDWDGDKKADIAVYRAGTPTNPQGYFYYRPSNQPEVNFIPFPWGNPGDKPVVADFDGDGKIDPAVFRPSNGVWFIEQSRDGFFAIQFGASEDKPVVGDYDKDGKADQVVFRPSNGVWYMWRSSDGFAAAQFGVSTDKPAPGDYDGDGQTDLAVYRDGNWFILNSTSGFASLGFGVSSDKPVPNTFIP